MKEVKLVLEVTIKGGKVVDIFVIKTKGQK